MQRIWNVIKPVVMNKYILTLLVFLLWIGIFDTYNIVDRVKDVNRLRDLQEERDFFREEIQSYRTQLEQLNSSPEMLEKFAREQHLMKAPNEDVFIIVDVDDE
ncbi:MAG: FtsB family cell division protein [Bacteroidales bacterium]